MRKLVESGNYVTGVSQDANGGLVFTMSNGSPITIGNVINGEKVEAGDKVTFNEETGEILLNGEPTGKFVSKTQAGEGKPAEVKVPFVKDGVLYVYNEAGEAEATGIRVNPITAVQNPETGSWTLTITAADGTTQEIKVPSANDMVTSLQIVQSSAALAVDAYQTPFVYAGEGKQLVDVNKNVLGAKGGFVPSYKADGTKGTYVDIIVTPSTIDAKDLKFKLQNSLGKTVWTEGIVTESTQPLTKAGTGVYRVYFNLADGIVPANLTVGDDNMLVASTHKLAVACGSTISNYVDGDEYLPASLPSTKTAATTVDVATGTHYVKFGEAFDIFGTFYKEDPSKNSGAATSAFLTNATNFTSYKITVDENIVDVYGIAIEGSKVTISNPVAYGQTIDLKLVCSDANSEKGVNPTFKPVPFKVTVQSKEIVAGVTLKAEHTLALNDNPATPADERTVYVPIEAIANAITGLDKVAWNETACTYANIVSIENNGPAFSDNGLKFSSVNKHGKDKDVTLSLTNRGSDSSLGSVGFVKADKKKATTFGEAKYLVFNVNPAHAQVTADTYSTLVQVKYGKSLDKNVKATIELTLKNPTLWSRIPAYFNGDNFVAYGAGATSSVTGTTFDVVSLYNHEADFKDINVAIDKEGMAKDDKPHWNVNTDGKTLEIGKEVFYKENPVKLTLTAKVFDKAIYNTFKDVIYVTAKSPVKDGTFSLNTTTLDLSQGAAKGVVFTQKDFVTKDVFNDAYNLFNVSTPDAAPATTVTWGNKTDKITALTLDYDKGLVVAEFVTGKADGTFDTATDPTTNTYTTADVAGIKVSVLSGAQVVNGQEVKLTLTATDKWGQEIKKEIVLKVQGLN